jgi:hypothetical protein
VTSHGSGISELRMGLDRVAFAEKLGVIPDPWQQEFLRSTSDRILLNCARQSGKSTLAAVIGLHRVIYRPGSLVLVAAPALRQSQELFAKVMDYYITLGEPMKKYGERRLSLELTNGSRIGSLPGSEATVRGYSGVSMLILDECARIHDELYYATRPMLATSDGDLLLLSTPWGRRGAFYQEWTKGGPDWERYEVPASECPRITQEFLDSELKALGEWFYQQEYSCMFMDTEDSVFTAEMIEGAFSDEIVPLFERPLSR